MKGDVSDLRQKMAIGEKRVQDIESGKIVFCQEWDYTVTWAIIRIVTLVIPRIYLKLGILLWKLYCLRLPGFLFIFQRLKMFSDFVVCLCVNELGNT